MVAKNFPRAMDPAGVSYRSVTITIDVDTFNTVRAMALGADRSVSNMIHILLQQALNVPEQ